MGKKEHVIKLSVDDAMHQALQDMMEREDKSLQDTIRGILFEKIHQTFPERADHFETKKLTFLGRQLPTEEQGD